MRLPQIELVFKEKLRRPLQALAEEGPMQPCEVSCQRERLTAASKEPSFEMMTFVSA